MTASPAERHQALELHRQHGDLRAYTVVDWVVIALKASIGLALAQMIVAAVVSAVGMALFMFLAMLGASIAVGS